MNLSHLVFTTLIITVRLNGSCKNEISFLDPVSDTTIFGQSHNQSAISLSQATFYDHFISPYLLANKSSRSSSCCTSSLCRWTQISLLLCGDVHPCPGPNPIPQRTDSTSSTPCDKFSVLRKRGLHFLHLNIRSLLPKHDELCLLAKQSNADIICLSETWLDNSVFDSEISINGYTVVRRDRNRHGGGVCIYIRNTLSFNIRDDLEHSDLEALFIDILLPKSKPILCGVIYRPPKQTDFYNILETVLLSCSSFNSQENVILGDFNTNVSKTSTSCPLSRSLKSLCSLFSFKQLIHAPTRIFSESSSIIDLILASDPQNISQSGVIDCSLSDHQLIFCTRKLCRSKSGNHNTVFLRSLKNYNKEAFQQHLVGTDWSSVLLCENVHNAWNSFKHIFTSAIESVAPLKQVRIKQRTEPWISSEILQHIVNRDKAYNIFKQHKSEENLKAFREIRTKTQILISKAKKNYFKTTIEENKHDSKNIWKNLKILGMPTKKSSSSGNIGLAINDEICFDRLSVAEKFNSFYTSVASKLVEKLPKCLNKFGSSFVFNYYSSKGVKPNFYNLSIVTEIQVLKYINLLGLNKATGLDGIPARFVLDSASIIASPLSHIINLSIIQGSVPDDLKLARVVPLYKKNDKTEVGNYRPVSILSIVSKVLERVVYDQVYSYLSNHDLLYQHQSGFRQGFSTETCLINLTDYLRSEMDKGNMVGMVLLDLQKAFDTVDHGILLMKLRAIGLAESSVSWFSSYLSDRHQLVDVSGTLSSRANINCGVPQGSILGPLLFLIYVNDMSAVVKHRLNLYADDSGILVSGKCKSEIENVLSTELEAVSEWLICNKLSLHLGKTESILFGSKTRLRNHYSLNVTCNGQSIVSKDSVKYLGATIDQTLSFESMVMSIIQKVNGRLKFLYRKREYLSFHTKKMLIMAIIQCHLDYASPVWYYSLTQSLRNKLQVTQNKMVRFVMNLDARSHIGKDEFSFVKWLPVEHRVKFKTLCHVFKIHSGESPLYMQDMFTPASSVHSYSTRFRVTAQNPGNASIVSFSDSGRYSLPKVKGFGKRSFAYIGCSLWNDLPQCLRSAKSIQSFKIRAKEHLLSSVQS